MNNYRVFLFIAFVITFFFNNFQVYAQQDIKWINIEENNIVVRGQGWRGENDDRYGRLPEKAKPLVRPVLWSLSKETAGLSICFKTGANEIRARYGAGKRLSMPHMPATGVSGLDLYAKTANGEWLWAKGNYSFGDTVNFVFGNLDAQMSQELEYYLYLPLYNSVDWLEIGVPSGDTVYFTPLQKQKPIVVYGTSIAQGACASRPGMAWTNILGRELQIPVINLGFSGNGRLEEELIDLINEIDAGMYVLDCLPNMTEASGFDPKNVQEKIEKAVKMIRKVHPETPVLLTGHCGYGGSRINSQRARLAKGVNSALSRAFQTFEKEKIKGVYRLTKEQIGLDLDSTVDGIHPSDRGMMQYANAYAKEIKKIQTNEIKIKL